MKLFLLLVVLFTFQFANAALYLADIEFAYEHCLNQAKNLDKRLSHDQTSLFGFSFTGYNVPRSVKCFSSCLLDKLGATIGGEFVDSDPEIDQLLTELSNYLGGISPTIDDVIKCRDGLKGTSDHCRTAWQFVQCLANKLFFE